MFARGVFLNELYGLVLVEIKYFWEDDIGPKI